MWLNRFYLISESVPENFLPYLAVCILYISAISVMLLIVYIVYARRVVTNMLELVSTPICLLLPYEQ